MDHFSRLNRGREEGCGVANQEWEFWKGTLTGLWVGVKVVTNPMKVGRGP